jgi:hypothetical protein
MSAVEGRVDEGKVPFRLPQMTHPGHAQFMKKYIGRLSEIIPEY